jgi:hypothetical protein
VRATVRVRVTVTVRVRVRIKIRIRVGVGVGFRRLGFTCIIELYMTRVGLYCNQ